MNNYLIAPDTDIYLLKVPFEMDEENVLSFANATAQSTYFLSLPKLYLENATYQRKDGVLRYPAAFDDLLLYNYCMYRNTAFSNKWFYAYIEDMKFSSSNMTEITLRTDVWQTWQFSITYHKMFVAREHVNNDTIGAHTVPEGLETGDYISTNKVIDSNLTDLCVILGCTEAPIGTDVSGGIYGGVYSGLGYQRFFIDTAQERSDLADFINSFADNGRADALKSLFMAPKAIAVNIPKGSFGTGGSWGNYVTYNLTYTRPSKVGNNFTPKNNKLFTFPYMYLLANNNNGITKVYKYELFSSGSLTFQVDGSPCVGCSIKMSPKNYMGITVNNNESISCGKFPTCSWASDEYTNWLTQNAVNANVGIAGALVSGAIGGAAAGPIGAAGGAIIGGGAAIANYLLQRYQKSFTPDSANGNITLGDINTADGTNTFILTNMTIKNEYAQIIDDYFSAYGYQVNSYKTPNITGRTYWNYVKTQNCNITGEIPQKDLQELKKMFDSGLTIWHDATKFLDYSQNNTIVS